MASSLAGPIYKNQEVRALAWAIGSPNILSDVSGLHLQPDSFFVDELERARPFLAELDADPAPLLRHLNQHGHWRVGLYFERLISFWLTHHPTFVLVCQEIQIVDKKRTIGALDLIVETAPGHREHWEIAVKFYLQAANDPVLSAWIGPNKRDRLDLKTEKMINHQLPLSNHPVSKARLEQYGVGRITARRGILKGTLCRPFGRDSADFTSMNANAKTGYWVEAMRVRELLRRYPESRWTQRIKPDWLGDVEPLEKESLGATEMLQHLSKAPIQQPAMWTMLQPNQLGWCSQKTVFIVQNNWCP